MPHQYKRLFLVILDGFGYRPESEGNAVKLAKMPFFNSINEEWRGTLISATGKDVGLPDGLMGNSEVGHLNIGAGRIVYQEISRIDKAIEDGSFFVNPVISGSINHAKQNGSNLHLIGLVSDGGVHSSLEHLHALLRAAKDRDLDRVYIHAITDGRDTPPHSGAEFITQVEDMTRETGIGAIATVCGRYWAMDRDKRWDRVERAYRLYSSGEGLKFRTAVEAVENSYKRGITDEFIEPSLIDNQGAPPVFRDRDAVFFWNFRADRTRELTLAFTDKRFSEFRVNDLDLHYSTLTKYRDDFDLPAAFLPERMQNILGEVLESKGLRQFRIAETEKYAHATYFFNGGIEIPFAHEERKLVHSPKVATYDMQPEMSAPEVAEHALDALDKDYTFIFLNFANPDMIGHTGMLEAAIRALETVDKLLKTIVEKALLKEYAVIITSDHGNCELMIDTDGEPHTAHTTNKVPLILLTPDGWKPALRSGGILADVAPTVLHLLGMDQPVEMTGRTLVNVKNSII